MVNDATHGLIAKILTFTALVLSSKPFFKLTSRYFGKSVLLSRAKLMNVTGAASFLDVDFITLLLRLDGL